MTAKNRSRAIGAVFTVFLSLVLTITGNTIYTVHAVRESQQQLCGVLDAGSAPPPTPPINPELQPTTEYGRALKKYNEEQAAAAAVRARELKKLYISYKCGGNK